MADWLERFGLDCSGPALRVRIVWVGMGGGRGSECSLWLWWATSAGGFGLSLSSPHTFDACNLDGCPGLPDVVVKTRAVGEIRSEQGASSQC